MKSLDNELEALSDELERLDYVVVKHGEWVCVRLPLVSYVRSLGSRGDRFRHRLWDGSAHYHRRFPRRDRADTRRVSVRADRGMPDAAPAARRDAGINASAVVDRRQTLARRNGAIQFH